LYFCDKHGGGWQCERCLNGEPHFEPKPEHPDWIQFKMTDPSWEEWRQSPDAEEWVARNVKN
jgi:hypothetical protein